MTTPSLGDARQSGRTILAELWLDAPFRYALLLFGLVVAGLVAVATATLQAPRATVAGGIVLIVALMAATEWRRRSSEGPAARFWGLALLGFTFWLASWAPRLLLDPERLREPSIGLARDVLYLGLYVCLVVALEIRTERAGDDRRSQLLGSFQAVAASIFAFGLLIYFVLLPGAADRAEYATRAPSLLLYAALDAYLVIRLALRRRSARHGLWRLTYGALLVAAVVWLFNDLGLLLDFLGVTAFVHHPMLVVPRQLDFLAIVAATRMPGLPLARRAARRWGEREIVRVETHLLWGGPLVAYMCILPIAHFGLYAAGALDTGVRLQRELLLVVLLLALAVIAMIYQQQLAVENRRLTDEAQERLRLTQRLESLGQLTAGIAHDLNNLITVILGSAGFIREQLGSAPGEVLQDVMQIEQAAERCAAMVRRVVTFGKGRPGAVPLVMAEEMVHDVGRVLRRVLPASITLELLAPPPTRPARMDPAALEQVLLNLVTNARDAMPNGGRLSVRASPTTLDPARAEEYGLARAGDYCALSVSDNGVGMPPEVQARLFEPFFSTKVEGRGAGLGMAMVAELVRLYEGSVLVRTAPGRGTTITVYIPLADTADRIPARPAADAPRAAGATTILVVEDDDALRSVARRALVGHGYRVIETGDGLAALKLFAEHAADIALVLTDLDLPGARGAELIARIRARYSVPIILTSGYTEQELAAVPADIRRLHKPWTLHDLLAAVSNALGAKPPG